MNLNLQREVVVPLGPAVRLVRALAVSVAVTMLACAFALVFGSVLILWVLAMPSPREATEVYWDVSNNAP